MLEFLTPKIELRKYLILVLPDLPSQPILLELSISISNFCLIFLNSVILFRFHQHSEVLISSPNSPKKSLITQTFKNKIFLKEQKIFCKLWSKKIWKIGTHIHTAQVKCFWTLGQDSSYSMILITKEAVKGRSKGNLHESWILSNRHDSWHANNLFKLLLLLQWSYEDIPSSNAQRSNFWNILS